MILIIAGVDLKSAPAVFEMTLRLRSGSG